jgi:hypothetical protein
MTEWRDHAVAAALLDGRVLIVGGNGGGGDDQDLASAELFDPKTNTFSATGSMYQQHGRQATATLLADGRVLVVGGADHDGMKPSSDAELYDPSTGKFTETGQTTEPAWYHTATRLRDGRVLILNSDQALTSSNQTGNEVTAGGHSQIYDPATGKFAPGAPMKTIAMPEVAIVLGDGRVLVVGEQANGSGAGPATAELFDPASGTFVSADPLAFQPSSVVGTVMTDGRVLIAGGGVIQIFDPSTGKFTRAGTLSSSHAMQQVIALPDGHVLVTYSDPGDPSTGPLAAEVFSPVTGKTTRTGPMIEDRADYTATLMIDGRVLIAGGALIYLDHNVGELFDPGTNTFRATGP